MVENDKNIFKRSFQFFTFNIKLSEMAMLASKDFTAAKKMDHWIKNLMLIHLS